jgi:hypothetical protein
MANNWKLKADILKELDASPGQPTQELAGALASFEPDVERVIQEELKNILYCDRGFGWYLLSAANEELEPPAKDLQEEAPEGLTQGLKTGSGAMLAALGKEIVSSAPQSLRKRLLDLIRRNKLLTDELPDELKHRLLNEETNLRFCPYQIPRSNS